MARRPVFPVVVLAALCAGVFPPAAKATSPLGIGIQKFTATGPQDILGAGFSDILTTDAVELLHSNDFKACNLVIVEVKRRADIQKEIDLQKNPAFDQTQTVKPRWIKDNISITGHVDTTDTALSVKLTMTDTRSGEVIARFEKTAVADDVLELSQEALKEMLDKLCPKRHRLKVGVGPYFQIDTTVCGITKPFSARPKGEFGGVKVSFTPSSDSAGSFVEGGKAYGTQWSGGGDYTIAWSGDTGRFVATNPNTAQNASGTVTNNDMMTGTVTRLKERCAVK